jgi:hypothetical protein
MSKPHSKAFLEIMENLSPLVDWCKAHSPAELAEAVGKMTPEDRSAVHGFYAGGEKRLEGNQGESARLKTEQTP